MTKQEIIDKINKLENGIKSKATPSNLITPLKAQKRKFEELLKEREEAEKKAIKTKKVSKIAEKIKSAKKSVAKKTPAKAPAKEERKKDNIARDGDRKSLPSGKRISKSGKVYYETRANRSDKQTSKKPYLADGGMVEIGSEGMYRGGAAKVLKYDDKTKMYAIKYLNEDGETEGNFVMARKDEFEYGFSNFNPKMAKGGDVYDDMNDEIEFANKKAKKIANSLESLGYKVIKVQEADYDTDAQIDLSEKVNVQVGLEGDLSIVIEKEEGKFTYIECGKSYATLLQKLPNIDKQYMEKGGKTKRTVKLTLSDKDSYDYTYKQDGATASITFGFGKEPFQYEVKKISKSLEPLQQDILDTFTLQGIKQHDYKGGFSEAIKHLDTSILENMDEFAKGGSTKGNWILRRNIGYGTKYKDLTNGDKIRMNLGNDEYYHGTINGQEILWEDGIKTNLTTSFGGSNANDKEVLRFAKGGELKKAQLLIIDPSNPLSTQLKKLTGDFLNSADFKDIGSGNFNILTHKHSNKIFIVYPKRIYDSLPEHEKQDDISYLKNVEKIRLDTRSMADGGSLDKDIADKIDQDLKLIGIKKEKYQKELNQLKSENSQDRDTITYLEYELENLDKLQDKLMKVKNSKMSDGGEIEETKEWKKQMIKNNKETIEYLKNKLERAQKIGQSENDIKTIKENIDFHTQIVREYEKELNELKNKNMNYAKGGELKKHNVVTSNESYANDLLKYADLQNIAASSKMLGNKFIVTFDAIPKVMDSMTQDVKNLVNKMADGGEIYSLAENMTDAEYERKLSSLNEKQKKTYESLVRLGDSPKLALATTLLSNEAKWSDDTTRAYTMADGGKVPAHFGSGKNINVFGYQTENFDICATAVKEFESAIQIMDNGKETYKESLAKCAKYIDNLFGIEKYVVENGDAEDSNFYEAISDIMSASIYNYRAEMSINLFSFVPQHLKEIAVRMAKAEKGGLYALGGMTAGRYYKDKSGEEFKFIGKIDSGANKGKFLFNDGQKSVYKDLEDFEGGTPKETKLFGFFEDGGEVGKSFSIREMREKLNRMFPDSFGFSVGNVSKEGNKTLNSAALIVDSNDPFRGLEDKDIDSKLFFPQYKRDHNINFRVSQGGENTYFYFGLESEKGDELIGQFGFKDQGMVSSDYITRFIALLMEQYGLPFEIKHSVMEKGGYMADGGETAKFEVDDVVYHKGHNTIGIVRMEESRGEVKTDADGNVNVDELQYYNPLKHEAHKNANIAPSTFKEIEERGLWNPFNDRTSQLEKGGYMAKGGEVDKELIDSSAKTIYDRKGMMSLRNTFLQVAKADEDAGDKETAEYRRKVVAEYQAKQPRYMADGGKVSDIDMAKVESSAKFYTDESRWSTKPTIGKFEAEIKELEEVKRKLDNKETTPSKIIGSGIKPSLARPLAYRWLKEQTLIAKRAIEMLKEKEKMAKGGETNYTKKWRVFGITMQGKRFDKEITLGRMSDKNDVMNALKRMYDTQIREVTSIQEVMADGGEASIKNFNTMMNVGKAKYVINHHDGKKTHKDGSPFYDLATFKNMKDFIAYKKKLKSEGYKEYKDGGMMAKGGKTQEKYEIELFFKGLSGDARKIGKYVVTQKTLEILENEWYDVLSIDVLDESDAKPIAYNELREKLYSVASEKGFKYGGKMSMGGKVKFADKVKAVQASLLKRKKVAPQVQKDYGKTYNKAEAKESAQRIVASRMAQLKEKMAKKKK